MTFFVLLSVRSDLSLSFMIGFALPFLLLFLFLLDVLY